MREPAFWWRNGSALGTALSPLGTIYGTIAAARMRQPGTKAEKPVICVGNFTLGGTGKTPTAIMIARQLTQAGETPFFLTRGYGGSESGPTQVRGGASAAEVGDEPLLLARTAPVIVARDRAAGAALAAERGASIVVMDDGLQNPSLAKDFSIAVVDAARSIGNARIFPAGPLRAPLDVQSDRVNAVIVVGDAPADDRAIEAATKRHIPVYRARLVPDAEAIPALRGKRLFAFAGIGNPDKFFTTLGQAGLDVAEQAAFPDHHRFTPGEARLLVDRARTTGLQLVTTEKDLARMTGDAALDMLAAQATALPVALTLDRMAEFFDQLWKAVRRPR